MPVREVRRLPYFDFQEVAAARRLAELLAAGVSPETIEKKLEDDCPLSARRRTAAGTAFGHCAGQADSAAAGRRADRAGRADAIRFRALERGTELPAERPLPSTPGQMASLAAELEEDGQLAEAAEMYRAAMAAGGPKAELCFQMAELLYRLGDLAGRPRTILHGRRTGRRLRRSPGEPGLRTWPKPASSTWPSRPSKARLIPSRLRRRALSSRPHPRRASTIRRSRRTLAALPRPGPRKPLGRRSQKTSEPRQVGCVLIRTLLAHAHAIVGTPPIVS